MDEITSSISDVLTAINEEIDSFPQSIKESLEPYIIKIRSQFKKEDQQINDLNNF